MTLAGLIEIFKAKYKLECFSRKIPENHFTDYLMLLMLSESAGDLQKLFGVIEYNTTKSLIAGTPTYEMTSAFMSVKNVVLDGQPLKRRSTDWMETQLAQSGYPTDYCVLTTNSKPKIWLYPNPSNVGSLYINCELNIDYAIPSASPYDFGGYTLASTDEIFQAQYNKLLVLGMLKQILKDLQSEYDREKQILMVRQYNGEKFDYDPEWGEHFSQNNY